MSVINSKVTKIIAEGSKWSNVVERNAVISTEDNLINEQSFCAQTLASSAQIKCFW